ncbi:hypothetical protein TNCT_232471 [Trichonephila clavata]|uniref:Uncharacterized protein n=1 Tax=Trichonephila clavata TaxID=2740835 RepID=A0A8X6HLJ6_TRICU|nr:hypothetical protein TNCT_232471 [Trichonephila clavata]
MHFLETNEQISKYSFKHQKDTNACNANTMITFEIKVNIKQGKLEKAYRKELGSNSEINKDPQCKRTGARCSCSHSSLWHGCVCHRGHS